MKTPYVYKFVNKITDQFYIGCRWSPDCDTEESYETYSTSSKLVSELIKDNPDDWAKLILLTGDMETVVKEEIKLIRECRNDSLCLNGKRSNIVTIVPEPNINETQKFANKLGSAIRKRRKELKYTQADLAKSAGIGRRLLILIESGQMTVSLSSVLTVLQILGLLDQIDIIYQKTNVN